MVTNVDGRTYGQTHARTDGKLDPYIRHAEGKSDKNLYAIKESSYYVYESSCESCILPDLGSTILAYFRSLYFVYFILCVYCTLWMTRF